MKLALGSLKFGAVVREVLRLGIVTNEDRGVVCHELGQIDVVARVADHGLKGHKDVAAVGGLRRAAVEVDDLLAVVTPHVQDVIAVREARLLVEGLCLGLGVDGHELLESVAVKVDELGKLDAADLVVARAGRDELGLTVLLDQAVELALIGRAGRLVRRVVDRGGRGGVDGVLGRVGLLVGLAGLGAACAVARRARIVLGRGVVAARGVVAGVVLGGRARGIVVVRTARRVVILLGGVDGHALGRLLGAGVVLLDHGGVEVLDRIALGVLDLAAVVAGLDLAKVADGKAVVALDLDLVALAAVLGREGRGVAVDHAVLLFGQDLGIDRAYDGVLAARGDLDGVGVGREQQDGCHGGAGGDQAKAREDRPAALLLLRLLGHGHLRLGLGLRNGRCLHGGAGHLLLRQVDDGGAGRGVSHAERLHGLGGCLGVLVELGDGGGVVVDVDERGGVVGDGGRRGCIVAGEGDGDGCVVVGLEDLLGLGGVNGRGVVDDGLGGRLGVGHGLRLGGLLGRGLDGIQGHDGLTGVSLVCGRLGGVCRSLRFRLDGVERDDGLAGIGGCRDRCFGFGIGRGLDGVQGHHGLAGICIDGVEGHDGLARIGDGFGCRLDSRCVFGRRLNGVERNDGFARVNGGCLDGRGLGGLGLGGCRSLGCRLGRYGRSAAGAKASVVRQLRSALRAKHKVSSLLFGASLVRIYGTCGIGQSCCATVRKTLRRHQ